MCGIAGIIKKDLSEVNITEIKLMTDRISHRGPDGEGHYINKNIALGHRRLAILDLSEAGHQPMINDDIILVFNGEIYNYIEIREELLSLGYSFNSNTDSEVIIKAYIEWGESSVNRFNGMWAFAIYDKIRNKIFASRDRFGIKPFYYSESNTNIYFGSEIKQLLPFIKEPKLNRQILYDFLYLGYHHHTNNTFFEEIKSLAAGHNLIFDLSNNTYEIEKFYSLSKSKDRYKTLEGATKAYKVCFDSSVNFRLRSDVKIGTCLSGGLDSSYVTKIASEKTNKNKKFTAITAKSTDITNDESHYAKIVSDRYNLNWKVTEPDKTDFISSLDEVIYFQEEPFGSPSIIMQYFVMKKAKEEGCIVMLDGQGGDETLLGYERYFIPYLKTIKNPFKRIAEFCKLSKNSKLTLSQLLKYYFYFSFPTIKKIRLLKKHHYILDENKAYFNNELSSKFAKSLKDLFKLQKTELTQIQLQKLLKFEDRNSMAHSIEARVPFIDHNLVECALSIPSNFKIKDGWSKYILRMCYGEDAPEDIVWRKNKFGFEAPTKKWMEDKEIYVKEILDSELLDSVIDKKKNIMELDIETIWKLFSIAKWAKAFNVRY